MVFNLLDQSLEFIDVELLFFNELRYQACVRVAVVARHDFTNRGAAVLALGDGHFLDESIGDGPTPQEAFVFEESYLRGHRLIIGAGFGKALDQVADTKITLFPKDVHQGLFFGCQSLFHGSFRMVSTAKVDKKMISPNKIKRIFKKNKICAQIF